MCDENCKSGCMCHQRPDMVLEITKLWYFCGLAPFVEKWALGKKNYPSSKILILNKWVKIRVHMSWLRFAPITNPKCIHDVCLTIITCIWHTFHGHKSQHWTYGKTHDARSSVFTHYFYTPLFICQFLKICHQIMHNDKWAHE